MTLELYDTRQAATMLRLAPQTLEKWCSLGGRGPEFVKVGGKVCYTGRAIKEFVTRNTRGGEKPRGATRGR